jgi:hypothetical protein
MAKLYKRVLKPAAEMKAMSVEQRTAYGKSMGLSESEMKRYEARAKYRKMK